MSSPALRSPRRRFLAAAASVSTVAGFASPVFGAGETVLRLSLPVPASTLTGIETARFTKLVEQKSNGSLRFENYFDSALASSKDVHPGIQAGIVDVTIMSVPWLAAMVPQLQVLDLPFLFPSRANMFRVLDGDLGRDLNAAASDRGFTVLSWGAYSPVEFQQREKRVRTPDDMKGLRIRVISSAISTSIIRTLGGIPVDIAMTELFIALQQRALDGVQITVTSLNAMKLNDVLKCLSITDSNLNSAPLLIGKKRFDSLAPPQQKALADAAKEFMPELRSKLDTDSKTAIDEFAKRGGTVDTVDKAAFRRALAPVYDEFRTRLGPDYVNRVIKLATG